MLKDWNMVKMAMLPKEIYKLNVIPIKIPVAEKYLMILIEPQVAITILKKNKVRSLTLPDFKTQHKATVIKVVWYW